MRGAARLPPLSGAVSAPAGLAIIVAYLCLHIAWAQLLRGPYIFVQERAGFMAVILPCIVLARRATVLRFLGYFRLPARSDRRFFLAWLALAVLLRLVLKALAEWVSPHSDTAALSWGRLMDECVTAPVNEELVFRGLLLLSLVALLPRRRWPVVILSTVIFLACHNLRYWETVVAVPILGVLLALAFLRTRSLSGCMLVHAAWNAMIFVPLPAWPQNSA